jgi:hypothetical protein
MAIAALFLLRQPGVHSNDQPMLIDKVLPKSVGRVDHLTIDHLSMLIHQQPHDQGDIVALHEGVII